MEGAGPPIARLRYRGPLVKRPSTDAPRPLASFRDGDRLGAGGARLRVPGEVVEEHGRVEGSVARVPRGEAQRDGAARLHRRRRLQPARRRAVVGGPEQILIEAGALELAGPERAGEVLPA